MKLFLAVLFLPVLISFDVSAQQQSRLIQINELPIHCDLLARLPACYPYFQAGDEYFFMGEKASSTLHKIDSAGNCVHHEMLMRKEEPWSFHDMVYTENALYLRNNGHVRQFDHKFQATSSFVLKIVHEEMYFSPSRARPAFCINENLGYVFFIVRQNIDSLPVLPQEKDPEFYNLPFVVRFPAPIKIKSDTPVRLQPDIKFGERSGQYLPAGKTANHLNENNVHYDEGSDKLFVSERITPKIRVYDHDGKLLEEFGEPGKFLTENDSFHYMPLDEYPHDTSGYTRPFVYERIRLSSLSPDYSEIWLDKTSGLLYRIYERPLFDSSNSEQDLTRGIVQKEQFLQIYKQQELFCDVPVPKQMNFFGAWGDKIYFFGKTEKMKLFLIPDKPTIYVYELQH